MPGDQKNSPNGSFWTRYRIRYGHLPWFRRYEFLVILMILSIAYGIWLLPAMGSLSGIRLILVLGFAVCALAWAILLLTNVETPRWLRTIAALSLLFTLGFLFYRYSGAQWDKLTASFFDFRQLQGSWPELASGLWMTVRLAFISMIISLILGMIVAVLRSFNNKILNIFLIIYIDLFRAIPLVVLLVFVYYALPYLGISLDPFLAAIVAVSLNYTAYVAEVFRSGIESIQKGQMEAARTLGLTVWQATRLVILPQAVRVVVPPTTGLMVALLKDTTLASIIALPELMYKGLQILIFKVNATPIMVVALIYLAVLLPMTRLSSVLENRSKRWLQKSHA
jgi:polar amino acid transport system permease protein